MNELTVDLKKDTSRPWQSHEKKVEEDSERHLQTSWQALDQPSPPLYAAHNVHKESADQWRTSEQNWLRAEATQVMEATRS